MSVSRPNHWPQTAGYFATFVALGMETAALGPTLPRLAEHTGTQLGAISFLFTAHSLGYLLGSYSSGRLYDRIPGNRLMTAMLLLMAMMLALIPLARIQWFLAGIWFGLGLAAGAVDVGGNTLLSWLHGRGLAPYMNALHFFFGLGSFLAPLIVGRILFVSGDINWAYWALALPALPLAFWLVQLPSPSPTPSPAANSPGQRLTNASGRAWGAEERAHGSRHRRVVVLISSMLLLYVGAEVAFGGWIYSYAVAVGLAGAELAAYLTSAFWGALMLGRLAGIPLAARFRPRSILAADLVGCLASLVVPILWPSSETALWLAAAGLGLAMASFFPVSLSLAERCIPITGRVTGWFLVGASIGGMSVPWLIGQFFEPAGPRSAMVIILLTLVAATAVLAVLAREEQ